MFELSIHFGEAKERITSKFFEICLKERQKSWQTISKSYSFRRYFPYNTFFINLWTVTKYCNLLLQLICWSWLDKRVAFLYRNKTFFQVWIFLSSKKISHMLSASVFCHPFLNLTSNVLVRDDYRTRCIK